MLAADVVGLGLYSDTGSSASDDITTDPTVSASVEYNETNTTSVDVEFDHDNDGVVDGLTTIYSSYSNFTYDPLSNDSSLETHNGNLPLRYRTVEHQSGGDVTSGWTSHGFTLDRVAPTVSSVTPSDSSVVSTAPTTVDVTFSEALDSATASTGNVWVEDASAVKPTQSVTLATSTKIEISFSGGLAGGEYDTVASNVADIAGNLLATQSTTDWRLTAAPTTTGITDVDVDEDAANSVIYLSSYFSDEFDSSSSLTYTVTANTNGSLFDSTSISSDQLTLDYEADEYGSATITVKAEDIDGLSVQSTFDVDVASVNDAPTITNFSVVQNGSLYTFTGTVVDENPNGLTVEFGGVISGNSTTTNAFGNFTFEVSGISAGTATAITTDDDDVDSNTAATSVY